MTAPFVDTSALAKRYVAGPGSAEFEHWFMQAAPVTVSILATVELTSTLRKCLRTERLKPAEIVDIEAVFSADVASDFIAVAGLPAQMFHAAKALIVSLASHGLRTLDALQLATALAIGAKTFVTADSKLASAAAAAGIQVLVFGRAG